MAGVSAERCQAIVNLTIRKDTSLVRALKKLADFQCLFPGCGVRIPKRGGGFYIEVAHIEPVHAGGQSVLGNLVVLCPNHHKEFDYGEPVIERQELDRVQGLLNGRRFEIRLPLTN